MYSRESKDLLQTLYIYTVYQYSNTLILTGTKTTFDYISFIIYLFWRSISITFFLDNIIFSNMSELSTNVLYTCLYLLE